MTYATQADLVERFGATELAQLTDAAGGAIIDETKVARALADADAEVDAHIGVRYALPLATTPVVLVRVAADIARYVLWDTRANDIVKARYQAGVGLRKSLQSGAARLGNEEAPAAAPGAVAVAVSSRTRVFSTDVLDAFSRSS